MIVDYYKPLRDQIYRLAEENNIQIDHYYFSPLTRNRIYRDDVGLISVLEAGADTNNCRIYVPEIKSVEAYICALHELGHCIALEAKPMTRWGYNERNILFMELAAWRFALQHIKSVFKDMCMVYANLCLSTYVDDIKKHRYGYVNAKYTFVDYMRDRMLAKVCAMISQPPKHVLASKENPYLFPENDHLFQQIVNYPVTRELCEEWLCV